MGFFDSLLSSLLGSKRKASDIQDEADTQSPAKRVKQEQDRHAAPVAKLVNTVPQQRPEAPPMQLLASTAAQHAMQPKQAMQPMQQPTRATPGTGRRQRQYPNVFKQLDSQQSSRPLAQLGGAADRSQPLRFFGGVPALQPHSSTPVLGWTSAATPAALHSHPRLPGITSSSRYRAQQQQAAAAAAAAAGGGGLGLAGATPASFTPDIKQRLSFDRAAEVATGPTAAQPMAARAAAMSAVQDASSQRFSASGLAAPAGPTAAQPGFFTAMMMRTAPDLGVAVSQQQQQPAAVPAAVAGAGTAAPAAAAAGAAGRALAPLMLLPSVATAAARDESRILQELKEKQKQLEKLTHRDETFAAELRELQQSNMRALALSPGYIPADNPVSRSAMLQMEQRAAQIQAQQELQLRDGALLQQQRGAVSPAQHLASLKKQHAQMAAAATPAAAAAAAASARPGSGQQQQQQQEQQQEQEDDSEVICLDDDDDDDDEEQQLDGYEQEHEGSVSSQQEEEEEEEEGEEEEEEFAEEEEGEGVQDAAAGIGALDIAWTGPRMDWAPTEQQLARFEQTTEGDGPGGEKLASHGWSNIDLTRTHFKCLRSGEWLNDEVINMYMALLQDRDTAMRSLRGVGAPRCHFFNTFFMNKLYKDDGKYCYKNVKRWTLPVRLANAGQASDNVLKLDRIILPVHQGMHWTAAMVDLAGRRFLFFDSMHGEDPDAIAALKRWVADEAKDKLKEDWDTSSWPELHPKSIPRQTNGWDCGVFTLLFCNRLGLGRPFDFAQADLEVNARVAVTCELLDGRLKVPGKQQHLQN